MHDDFSLICLNLDIYNMATYFSDYSSSHVYTHLRKTIAVLHSLRVYIKHKIQAVIEYQIKQNHNNDNYLNIQTGPLSIYDN